MDLTRQAIKVGMLGGAFDPPHIGHVALAALACKQLRLDVLHIVPTGHAWHKLRTLSPATQRLEMARLAFHGIGGVVIDQREIQRPGPTYTIDTMKELALQYPDGRLHLVIGEDQALALPTWYAWQELVRLAIICVAARRDSIGSGVRFRPDFSVQDRFCELPLPPIPVSATEIRERVARGADIRPLVGEPIARYIALHHLYQIA